jgi:hypothetical protein
LNTVSRYPVARVGASAAGRFLLLLGVVAWFGRYSASAELIAFLPWLILSLLSAIAPFFVARLDPFSPLGFLVIRGGLSAVSVIASAVVSGGVDLPVLGFLGFEQRLELVRSVCILQTVSNLAYLVGYRVSNGRLGERVMPRLGHRRWVGTRLLWTSFVMVAIFAISYRALITTTGASLFDLAAAGAAKSALKSIPETSWAMRGALSGLLLPLLIGGYACRLRSRPLLLCSILLYGVFAVATTRFGPRGPAVAVGLMGLATFHYAWRRIPAVPLLAILFGVVVGVQILGEYRASGRTTTTFREGLTDPVESLAKHEADRSRLQALAVIMFHFPEKHDYLLGESFKSLAVFWIPLWLWPSKTEYLAWRDTSIVYQLEGAPIPSPLNGVLYANFGWLGVVVGMALYGAFHRGLYRYQQQSPSDPGTTAVYIGVLSTFTPTALGLAQTLQFAVPMARCAFAVSRSERRAR